MEGKTNKEMLLMMSISLDSLTKSNEKISKDLFQLACDNSILTNNFGLFKSEILTHLESNSKTNQKGLIEQVKENTDGIISMKSDRKIDKTKIAIIWGVVGTAAGAVAKLVF